MNKSNTSQQVQDPSERITSLYKAISVWTEQKRQGEMKVSQNVFESVMDELKKLEIKYPHLKQAFSPTNKIPNNSITRALPAKHIGVFSEHEFLENFPEYNDNNRRFDIVLFPLHKTEDIIVVNFVQDDKEEFQLGKISTFGNGRCGINRHADLCKNNTIERSRIRLNGEHLRSSVVTVYFYHDTQAGKLHYIHSECYFENEDHLAHRTLNEFLMKSNGLDTKRVVHKITNGIQSLKSAMGKSGTCRMFIILGKHIGNKTVPIVPNFAKRYDIYQVRHVKDHADVSGYIRRVVTMHPKGNPNKLTEGVFTPDNTHEKRFYLKSLVVHRSGTYPKAICRAPGEDFINPPTDCPSCGEKLSKTVSDGLQCKNKLYCKDIVSRRISGFYQNLCGDLIRASEAKKFYDRGYRRISDYADRNKVNALHAVVNERKIEFIRNTKNLIEKGVTLEELFTGVKFIFNEKQNISDLVKLYPTLEMFWEDKPDKKFSLTLTSSRMSELLNERMRLISDKELLSDLICFSNYVPIHSTMQKTADSL